MKQEEPSSTQRQVNALQGRPEQVASKEGILPSCPIYELQKTISAEFHAMKCEKIFAVSFTK